MMVAGEEDGTAFRWWLGYNPGLYKLYLYSAT